MLSIRASSSFGWEDIFPPPAFEHVSARAWFEVGTGRGTGTRKTYVTPSWEEMCWAKSLFWEPEELVIQYHPPESVYVNVTVNVLHLWKCVGVEIPLPPRSAV